MSSDIVRNQSNIEQSNHCWSSPRLSLVLKTMVSRTRSTDWALALSTTVQVSRLHFLLSHGSLEGCRVQPVSPKRDFVLSSQYLCMEGSSRTPPRTLTQCLISVGLSFFKICMLSSYTYILIVSKLVYFSLRIRSLCTGQKIIFVTRTRRAI
jgi:hypothetical protein